MCEPIYREVRDWINRRRALTGPPDSPWPLDDPDTGENFDPERTVPRFWIDERLFDSVEVRERRRDER